MVDGRPLVNLKLPQAAVCPIHGEPFRKAWPKGIAQLTILVLETIETDPGLGDDAGGDVAKINDALLARPACERVPAERLWRMYLAAGIAVDDVCRLCRRRAPGTEYQRATGRRFGRKVETIAHVCFGCVLTRLRATGRRG